MKNIFQLLSIEVKEFSDLLLVPEQTLYSWLSRNSTIPSSHSGYFFGLELYQQNKKGEDLKTVITQWESNNRSLLEVQKTEALRELRLSLLKNDLAWEKLKKKESKLLNRIHFSQNYPKYISPDLQKSENLLSWCNLMYRRSNFDLGDLRMAIQKLEQKKAGLAAQVDYWEGILSF